MPGKLRTGVVLGLVAYALFAIQDAAIKALVETLPVWQVLFTRSLVCVGVCLAIGRRRLLERALATPARGALLSRGVVTFAAWGLYYYAARSLPLGQLTTLYFAAPLLTTALAAAVLRERVSPARWAAVLTGFAGVCIAADPGSALSPAAGLVLLSALLWAVGVIQMRRIALREGSLVQMFFANLVLLVGGCVPTIATWTMPGVGEGVLLALVGLAGGLAQFCVFEAVRRAPAAVLATVEYSSLLWGFLLGALIWGDVPGPAVCGGAALIVLAAAVLVGAERRAVEVG